MFGKNKEVAQSMPQLDSVENNAALPLFFSGPQVITLERHAKARLRGDISMAFARNTNSIPLTAADIPEAAKHYPIVFTQDDAVIPVALVGLEQHNYFIDAKNTWQEGCYVPSYVRKYPFVFMEMPGSDQLTLCIDEAAIVLDGKGEGPQLYDDGHASAFVNNALEFCAAYQEQHRFTREFCEMLKQKNMLSPQRSDIELASGRMVQLNGFQLIDPEKFKALSEAEVFEWHKRGFLSFIHYIFQSHTNWRNLLEMANKSEGAKKKKG